MVYSKFQGDVNAKGEVSVYGVSYRHLPWNEYLPKSFHSNKANGAFLLMHIYNRYLVLFLGNFSFVVLFLMKAYIHVSVYMVHIHERTKP